MPQVHKVLGGFSSLELWAPTLPPLPPELFELIIQGLRGSPQDPAILQPSQMTLLVHYHHYDTQPILSFIDIVQSPTSTLFATVPVEFFFARTQNTAGIETKKPIYPFPGRFRLSRFPCLHSSTCLGNSQSYASFARFMTGFPALQDLELYDVNWEPSLDHFTFPHLELKTVTLSWDPDCLPPVRGIESAILSLRTPALTVHHLGLFPTDFSQIISKYLHHLGGHLQYLCLPK
ncbi:hypothetical protein C8F04DRAFT_1087273 [Mycena alexandri]|uniref:Uncharacterized protein n=1 Tax=Mycena alexandri TaxID=1745969 RepID=A0AAD6T633_9AGAR|nr:hypothetical protein C8F04DRAFT_1087273 [Mycena alexandri]